MSTFAGFFKNKNFSLFWFSQFISNLGDRFTQMALLTIVMILYADTGEKIAWITFYSLLPFFIFGPVPGILNNKLSRKKIIITIDVLRAILVMLLPFVSRFSHPMGFIYFIIFCVGVFSALVSSLKIAIISNFIEKEKIISVKPLVASSVVAATFIGVVIAGYLIKYFGPNPMFFVNAFTFLISAVMVAGIVILPGEQKGEGVSLPIGSVIKSLKDGFNFINQHQLILRIVQLNVVLSLLSAFFYINLLNYSAIRLKLFSQGYGILLVFLGLSLCSGAILLGRRISRLNYHNLLFVGFGIISLASVLMCFKPDFKFSVLIVILAGAGVSLVMITLESLLERAAPDGSRLNVFMARASTANFVFLLSLIIAGKALSRFNYFHVFAFVGLVSLIIAAIIYISEIKNKKLIAEVMEDDGLIKVDPNIAIRHIINFY